jgi:mRNA interferase RelE/StbE
MPFQVLLHKSAKKKFDKLADAQLKERLREAFRMLAEPFDLDTVKIQGEDQTYRTRIGKYRILEIIQDGLVYVFDFDTRGKIYK